MIAHGSSNNFYIHIFEILADANIGTYKIEGIKIYVGKGLVYGFDDVGRQYFTIINVILMKFLMLTEIMTIQRGGFSRLN